MVMSRQARSRDILVSLSPPSTHTPPTMNASDVAEMLEIDYDSDDDEIWPIEPRIDSDSDEDEEDGGQVFTSRLFSPCPNLF